MQSQECVKAMAIFYSDSSWPKHKQWQEVIEMDCPRAIKCTGFVMLKITSDSGMKNMNEMSLPLTLCT